MYVRHSWFPLRRVPITHSTFSYVLVEVIRELLTYGYQIEMGHVCKHCVRILVSIVVVKDWLLSSAYMLVQKA